MTKIADADYVEYWVRYGPERDKVYLRFMFGGLVGGSLPPKDLNDVSIRWSGSAWECGDGGFGGNEWRGSASNGRRWRHIAIPVGGFATYRNVSPKAAQYFDKILDSMCCGSCPACDPPLEKPAPTRPQQ